MISSSRQAGKSLASFYTNIAFLLVDGSKPLVVYTIDEKSVNYWFQYYLRQLNTLQLVRDYNAEKHTINLLNGSKIMIKVLNDNNHTTRS